MEVPIYRLREEIVYFDVGLLDVPRFGSLYLLQGEEVALVETATSLTVERTLAALDALRVPREAVRHILITHIHMDHSGGAWKLLEALPNAVAYIHEMTLPYLAQPERLVASVQRAVGPMFSRYGEMRPIPRERLRPAQNLELDLGNGLVLRALPTPGHAPDHLAYWLERQGLVFIGDALGIFEPETDLLFPVTPPPNFDPGAALRSLETLEALEADLLLFSHFGPHSNPREAIQRSRELLLFWGDQIEAALEAEALEDPTLIERLFPPLRSLAGDWRWMAEETVKMCVRGYARALRKARERGRA